MKTLLEAESTFFKLNGVRTFLLGMSYYGALGAPAELLHQDLDELQQHGFNWIRVWATWAAFDENVSAVDENGEPRSEFLRKLVSIVGECDSRGLVVDVTISRGNGVTGPPRLQTPQAHLRAAQVLVDALKDFRNWYLDLSNERNIQDQRFTSFEELIVLRNQIKGCNPTLLLTASHSPEINREDLHQYLLAVHLDFISPHHERKAESIMLTEKWTRKYIDWMNDIGRFAPVHYQEPFREGFSVGWNPTANDYLNDAQLAKAGGAAGWCFHNGHQNGSPDGEPRRCFDLRKRSLMGQLSAEEFAAVEKLKLVIQ